MSAEEIANAFVQHFYTSFDQNADQLTSLYAHNSMLTFEGQQFQGSANIVGKLKSVGPVRHKITNTDVQPSSLTQDPSAMIIFVTGSIQIGGDNENPLHFCETFQLVATAPSAYYIHNDMFRLNYGL